MDGGHLTQEGQRVDRLGIANIRADGGTQPRSTIDYDVVEEYAQALADGAEFPPVTVFYDGTDYWLADGFHRREAHQAAGLDVVNADLRQGTRRDAVLHSVGANAAHGLRRTNEDKRRAVQKLLDDSEWAQWSDRAIARRCGVSPQTVNNLRPQDTVQNGQSGRTFTHPKTGNPTTMNTSRIGQSKPKRDGDTPAFDNSRAGEGAAPTPQANIEDATGPQAPTSEPTPTRDASADYIYTAIRQAREAMSRLPDPEAAAASFPKDFWHTLSTEDADAIAEWWRAFAAAWAELEADRVRYAARFDQAIMEVNHAA